MHLATALQANRDALEHAFARDGNTYAVSVYDLRMVLSGELAEMDLVHALRTVIANTRGVSPAEVSCDTPRSDAASPSDGPAANGEAAEPRAAASLPAGYRHMLPPKPDKFTGREQESKALMGQLLMRGTRASLLLAGGGYGKSCLATGCGPAAGG